MAGWPLKNLLISYLFSKFPIYQHFDSFEERDIEKNLLFVFLCIKSNLPGNKYMQLCLNKIGSGYPAKRQTWKKT